MAIVHQSFTAAAGATANKPTGTSTGDVLVALVIGGSAASLSGWTVQANTNLASILFLTILTRVVDGSEGSSFTFTVTSPLRVGISRYSGVDTTTPVEGTPTQSVSANALTATAASVTTATAGAVLVHGVGWSSGTGTPASTPPGTMTEEWESWSASSSLLALNDETRASAGATGTRTSTITGPSGTLGHTHAVLIALKPAASDTPVALDDAGMITGTDALTVSASLSVSDSGTITGTDALAVDAALPLSDSGTITGADALAVDAATVLTDSGTITGTDALTVAVDAGLTDAGTISGDDALTIAADGPLSDAGTVTGDDALTVAADAAMSDSGTIGVTETLSISLIVPVSLSDGGTISVTESLSIVTRTIPRIGGLLRTGPTSPLLVSRQPSAASLLLSRAGSDAPLTLARTPSAAPLAVSRSESPAPLHVDRTGPGTPIEVTRTGPPAGAAVIRTEGEL